MKIIIKSDAMSEWVKRSVKEAIREFFEDYSFDFIMIYKDK